MPAWLRLLTRVGQPLVTITVLVLCAPGEHHLATLAGWNSHLAWGMAAVCAAYGGIGAAVASNLPKNHPGKRVALGGAVAALGVAMAMQPVSHLFVTGWLSATPRAPIWLVVIVSCVPAPILGHLLHVAAMPALNQPVTHPETPSDQPVHQTEPEPETGRIVEPTPLPHMPQGLLTTRQLMEARGVSRATINRWIRAGELTPVSKDPALGNLFHPASATG